MTRVRSWLTSEVGTVSTLVPRVQTPPGRSVLWDVWPFLTAASESPACHLPSGENDTGKLKEFFVGKMPHTQPRSSGNQCVHSHISLDEQ